MDFDPALISYDQLLQAFWNGHDASASPLSAQYRSIIFYHSDAQKVAALKSKAQEEARTGREIKTDIAPYTQFYMAENYHQKYNLQASDLFPEMSAIYPNISDLVNSTAAARLNAYLGGYGDSTTAKAQLDQLGLSEAGKKELLKLIDNGLSPVCPGSCAVGLGLPSANPEVVVQIQPGSGGWI
jgi:peptide-methionine (S)-S-oxide reductase